MSVSAGFMGTWTALNVKSTDYTLDRLPNGNYLATAIFKIKEISTSSVSVPTGARGYDVIGAPTSITTRILLNASKTQILAQAVLVENN